MLDRAAGWIERNSVAGEGVVVSSRQRVCYPEVTGYVIPTLLSLGNGRLACQYARWLVSVQRPDGSFGGGHDGRSYAFDTGQVVRGWLALLPRMPELADPLRRACDWLVAAAGADGRLPVPPPGADWNLGARGEVSEGTHLYVLPPLRRAAEVLGEPRYRELADRALRYYLAHASLTDFARPNALTHFHAYVQEALLDLGCETEARTGMESVARRQRRTGAVPAYHDVAWVCAPGLAQLALVWYRLGEGARAEAALRFLGALQNPSGGFFGSYGVAAEYFPAAEVAWAAKYAVEACQARIRHHFDETVSQYAPDIADGDGRVAAVLGHLGDLNGRRVLDAGCGKGRYAALLKCRYPHAEVTGLDVSAAMLRHVPAGIRTVQHGILDMPFADGAFDAVLCVEALEHVVRTEAAVSELARVLAPGGTLVVIDKDRARLGTLAMPDWEQWFGREELRALLRARGVDARAEPLPADGAAVPDGLFVCWAGRKVAALSEPSARN